MEAQAGCLRHLRGSQGPAHLPRELASTSQPFHHTKFLSPCLFILKNKISAFYSHSSLMECLINHLSETKITLSQCFTNKKTVVKIQIKVVSTPLALIPLGSRELCLRNAATGTGRGAKAQRSQCRGVLDWGLPRCRPPPPTPPLHNVRQSSTM